MLLPGAYPAAITPFDRQGRIDLTCVARLLAWFRSRGCSGVVLAGTQGEGPSLSSVEKRDLVRAAVPLAGGLPIILGIATASLEEAVWLCKQSHIAGAAAALVMPPAYFREASEEGLALWFEALFERSPLDIIVYNFPQRTGITLSAELMARLARHERMIGIKDSSGDPANLEPYAAAAPGKALFVGNESLLIDALRHGWSGTISGAANALPDWLSAIVADWAADPESAETKYELISAAIEAIRKSPQPATNKELLRRRGVIEYSAPRIPLLPANSEQVASVWEAVARLARP